MTAVELISSVDSEGLWIYTQLEAFYSRHAKTFLMLIDLVICPFYLVKL